MSTEKEFLKYGFLTVFVITGIVYLFTGDFNRSVNAACGGSLMVMFGLICLRYKTKEYINRNKLVNLLAYALLCPVSYTHLDVYKRQVKDTSQWGQRAT